MPRPSSDSTRDSPNRSNQTWITMKSREKNGKWNELLVIRHIIYFFLIMETPVELSVATNHIWFHQSDNLVLVILGLFKSNSILVLCYCPFVYLELKNLLIHCDCFPFLIYCTSCWNICPSGLFAWILSQVLHQGCLCHLDCNCKIFHQVG